MMPRWIEYGIAALLGVMIVADGVLVARVRYAANRASANASLKRAGVVDGPAPPLVGYTASGDRLNEPHSRSPAGWAVRYASRRCGYCARDTHWPQLALELERAGCPVTILVPRAGAELPSEGVLPAGAPQVAFVSVEWTKRFRLSVTPTLLLFSARGTLIWYRQGILAPDDLGAALQALEAARGTGERRR